LSGLKPTSFDPALRNGYRVVTGSGAGMAGPSGAGSASIVKSWRGPGWAAAKGIDSSEGLAGIARTVVHLKTRHALLIVDELAASTGEIATFEQFWHVASGLAPADSPEVPLLFTADDGTHLGVAYDDRHEAVLSTDRDSFSSCVRRRMQLASGVVATLFQRMDAATSLSVSLLHDSPDDWIVAISGSGLAARVSLNSNELRVDERQLHQAAV
jgi:hypothetical protein